MLYTAGTWGIFVLVHTSLSVDLVCELSGYVPGRVRSCDLRSSLWRFCFDDDAILQPGRSIVGLGRFLYHLDYSAFIVQLKGLSSFGIETKSELVVLRCLLASS